jgi:ATP-dependent protease HslVU (ClpYQ) peptidase subunit
LKDGLLYGFAGSFRMGQVLRYKFDAPALLDDENVDEYMRTYFIDKVRECFEENGVLCQSEDGYALGGHFLVALKGRLFEIETDFQVGELTYDYAALGSGREVAMGALHALEIVAMPAHEKVQRALAAAAEFKPDVRGPFTILETVYIEA